ncbi:MULTISPECIES: hypothetical protein [Streptomyces]|uniref:Integral membrane protein n=1 Tax=Streptomyces ramulosus TaxID=47762 RepID=A0ABW1FND8_9ACTN
MAVTISLAALFGIVLALLLRARTLGYGSAFIAMMFGFYLASTGVATTVNELTNAAVEALRNL